MLLKGEEICKLPLKFCIRHNQNLVKYFAQYYNNLSVMWHKHSGKVAQVNLQALLPCLYENTKWVLPIQNQGGFC